MNLRNDPSSEYIGQSLIIDKLENMLSNENVEKSSDCPIDRETSLEFVKRD